jgi:hypothetical protein
LKKTIFTLNTNPAAYKNITDLTYPFLKHYAQKIGADFYEIKERKFPEWTITYEKLQMYKLGQEMKNDWNIFIDADALVHPDTPDFSNHLSKDTVAHNGSDMASFRWKYDKYFWRDGRNIGSCTWMCWASDWCIDLYRPIDDMTPEEAYSNISPISSETNFGITPSRLIEDYVMSRNIAKYGLKFTTLKDIQKNLGAEGADLFFHLYAVTSEEKEQRIKQCLKNWGLS